jgi:hypothetical protein
MLEHSLAPHSFFMPLQLMPFHVMPLCYLHERAVAAIISCSLGGFPKKQKRKKKRKER